MNSMNQVMEITYAFLEKNHSDIKEIHDYTMALPEKYYNEYAYWINVAMALKATNIYYFQPSYTFLVNGKNSILIILVMH